MWNGGRPATCLIYRSVARSERRPAIGGMPWRTSRQQAPLAFCIVWRARKWIGAAPAAFRPYRRPALIERRIAAVLAAVPRVDCAPASAGPRRLAPLRARPALGVSVDEQQSHHCDTEQNKTDRAHGSSPSPSFASAAAYGRSPMFIMQALYT